MLGEPICVRTLSSHCRGPLRCSSIQQGVLVTVCRLRGQGVGERGKKQSVWMGLAKLDKSEEVSQLPKHSFLLRQQPCSGAKGMSLSSLTRFWPMLPTSWKPPSFLFTSPVIPEGNSQHHLFATETSGRRCLSKQCSPVLFCRPCLS